MIADYAELVIEMTNRCGDPKLAQRADMIVGFAEKDLNKRLRCAQMESEAELTLDGNSEALLPYDFEAARFVMSGTRQIPGNTLENIKRGECGFAVSGETLVAGAGYGTVSLAYYSSIQSIVSLGTNWLLQDDPEIYLFAAVKHGFLAKMEAEKAAAAEQYLDSLIGAFNRRDTNLRYSKTPMVLGGETP